MAEVPQLDVGALRQLDQPREGRTGGDLGECHQDPLSLFDLRPGRQRLRSAAPRDCLLARRAKLPHMS